MKKIAIWVLGVALIIGGIFVVLRDRTTLFTANSATAPHATFPPTMDVVATNNPVFVTEMADMQLTVPPTQEPVTETPVPLTPSVPVSITFVEHNVSCAIIPVGVNAHGTMETVPSANTVGWYQYGAMPSQQGNCIIAGHTSYRGQQGLFSILHTDLKVGDKIIVEMENGQCVFYKVDSIDQYLYYDVPDNVMAQNGDERLTLITCLGDYSQAHGTSLHRVVAVCSRVR